MGMMQSFTILVGSAFLVSAAIFLVAFSAQQIASKVRKNRH